jgi:hypothetical protein
METHKLSFCKINKLNDSVAEVIVNEGAEVDSEMVEEYHGWLAANLKPPYGLLINRINQYSYDFEAQTKIGDLPEIKAITVVVYSKISEVATRVLMQIPRRHKWNIEMFHQRQIALEWLEDELEK